MALEHHFDKKNTFLRLRVLHFVSKNEVTNWVKDVVIIKPKFHTLWVKTQKMSLDHETSFSS